MTLGGQEDVPNYSDRCRWCFRCYWRQKIISYQKDQKNVQCVAILIKEKCKRAAVTRARALIIQYTIFLFLLGFVFYFVQTIAEKKILLSQIGSRSI
jgi:hypothetical protein